MENHGGQRGGQQVVVSSSADPPYLLFLAMVFLGPATGLAHPPPSTSVPPPWCQALGGDVLGAHVKPWQMHALDAIGGLSLKCQLRCSRRFSVVGKCSQGLPMPHSCPPIWAQGSCPTSTRLPCADTRTCPAPRPLSSAGAASGSRPTSCASAAAHSTQPAGCWARSARSAGWRQ